MPSSPTYRSSPSPASHKPTAFRFKRKRPDDLSTSALPPTKRRSNSPFDSHRSHRHRRHRRRRRCSSSPNFNHEPDADTAFRESLFDALADDEGAAYWESVYGQPIHTYSPYISPRNEKNSEQAAVQRMTDEEYAAYVRARMWERSHGYIIEERRRRDEERIKRKGRDEEGEIWERRITDALKSSEERRRKNKWKDAWGRYMRGWDMLSLSEHRGGKDMKDRIPWPVDSGRYADVDGEQVKNFFRHAPQFEGLGEKVDLKPILKTERVRW
ncbi:MAG: hypothetical protein LQ341_004565 [Variospora aurantia]|nr:MAG: hypothetical protein LQ341_004565 [Variospora aurantia]